MPPHFTHSTVLNHYRFFLSKLTSKAPIEENRLRHGQKSKLLSRLRARALITQSSIDPFRTFRKLKTAVGRLRLKNETRRVIRLKTTTKRTEIEELFGSGGVIRWSLLFALGSVSKVFMRFANCTSVIGREHLEAALDRRPNQPLITVSNHTAAIDDPLIIASLVPNSMLLNPEKARWTLCATDRCFKNDFLSSFFRSVKVLPIERGAGLNQLGMKASELCLNRGGWIHIFPEGTRNQTGELLPPRLGIGKLIASCEQLPLVVPFIHSGMDKVMPSGSLLPKIGNEVRVVVGAPISFQDVVENATENGWTDRELFEAISKKIGVIMAQLWSELEDKPLPSWAQDPPQIPIGSTLSKEVKKLKQRASFSVLELVKDEIQKRVRNWSLNEYLEYINDRQSLMIASLKT